MLGRSVGLTDEQIDHLSDEVLPEGLFTESDAAIVRYAQVSTRSIHIDRELYAELEKHFSVRQMMELCLLVGMANFSNRLHATFLTDVDGKTLTACDDGACAVSFPAIPTADD